MVSILQKGQKAGQKGKAVIEYVSQTNVVE